MTLALRFTVFPRSATLAPLLMVVFGVVLWPHGAIADSPRYGIPGAWEAVQITDGITVKRRPIPGSKVRELQARGVIEAPLARVLAVLEDEAHRPAEAEKCLAAIRVASLGPAEGVRTSVLYDRVKAAWPAADRDVVLRVDTRINASEHFVRLDFSTFADDCVPVKKGVVRMQFLRGHYLLRPLHDGAWTDVEYQVHADPGGSVPGWISNLTEKQLPLTTVKHLREQAPKARFNATADTLAALPQYPALVGGSAASTPKE